MAILLFCEGTCKKQMGSLEPFIIHEDKYMCTKCAPIKVLTLKGMPEFWTWEDSKNLLSKSTWSCHWTPDVKTGPPFPENAYLWWNGNPANSFIIGIPLTGGWQLFKHAPDTKNLWVLDCEGPDSTAKVNLEAFIANFSKK